MNDEDLQRRRFPRIPSENAVLVTKLGPEEVEQFATTRTVGLGGCMFISSKSLGDGTPLRLLISVGRRTLRVLARVVYEMPRDDDRINVGVEFLELDPADRTVLEDLLSHDPAFG